MISLSCMEDESSRRLPDQVPLPTILVFRGRHYSGADKKQLPVSAFRSKQIAEINLALYGCTCGAWPQVRRLAADPFYFVDMITRHGLSTFRRGGVVRPPTWPPLSAPSGA